MWDTRLWLSDEEGDDYLLEPEERGPELKVGQRFLYTPGNPPMTLDDPYPDFVGDLSDIDMQAQRDREQAQRDLKQERAQWLKKVDPLRGQWFVDELYWELADGRWVQNVVLTRMKSSRRPQ